MLTDMTQPDWHMFMMPFMMLPFMMQIASGGALLHWAR